MVAMTAGITSHLEHGKQDEININNNLHYNKQQ